MHLDQSWELEILFWSATELTPIELAAGWVLGLRLDLRQLTLLVWVLLHISSRSVMLVLTDLKPSNHHHLWWPILFRNLSISLQVRLLIPILLITFRLRKSVSFLRISSSPFLSTAHLEHLSTVCDHHSIRRLRQHAVMLSNQAASWNPVFNMLLTVKVVDLRIVVDDALCFHQLFSQLPVLHFDVH